MEEKQLIESCLHGNAEDFKIIVEKYSAPAMALNILGNRDDAEDVCQEAFIRVFRNLGKFDKDKSFKNWLYAILYRRCLDQLRCRRRSFALLKKVQMESLSRQASEPDSFPEDKSLSSRLLCHLKPKERIVLCLWANEGYTAQEISEVLRCSASTARVYLFQARRKIKILLEKKMSHCKMTNFFYAVLPLKVWRDYLIRRHIQRCPSCQAKLASREEAESLLVSENKMSPRPSLWPEIELKLAGRPEEDDEKKPRQKLPLAQRRWRWAAAAAGLVIVGLTSIWLFKEYEPEKTMTGGEESERFRINYLKVENKPAQAYLYQPRESNMIIIWIEKTS